MKRFVIPTIGLGMLVASGVLYAVQTGHARNPVVLAESARRIDTARDIAINGWSGERIDLAARQLNAAQAAGGGSVQYRSLPTGPTSAAINVMLLSGPHGPISVHPPTACFRGAGYRQMSPKHREKITAADGTVLGTFWVTDFQQQKKGIVYRIRTWWAWSTDGRWQAPKTPRLQFAGEPVLYKLYLTERIPVSTGVGIGGTGADDGAEIRQFAQHYLPRLRRTLFEPSGS